MMTTAAGNLAGHSAEKDKEKEKPGMRRALGRGLASLLPGPRAVTPAVPAVAPTPAPASAARSESGIGDGGGTRAGAPAPHAPAPDASGEAKRDQAAIEISTVADESHTEPGDLRPDRQPGTGAAWVPNVEMAELDPAGSGQSVSASPGIASDGPIEISAAAERRPRSILMALPITDIDRNPFQTRHVQDDEALEELSNSIKTQGVVQPIVVRPSDEDKGRYVLILGERRLHASKKAGKTHIPAIVREVSEQQAAEMTIIENLQREDLSPMEQAEAFRNLSTHFNLTQQEIGQRVGLSRASISNYMRLLKLPHSVMDMLANKVINFAQAKELLKLEDNDRIAEAAIYAVKRGMSIEQIEMLVLRMEGLLDPLPDMPGVKKKEKTSGGARWVDPNVRAAQMDLERTLGLRVRIRDRKGKGRIVIEYSTVDDYDRVLEMLRGKK